MGHDKAHHADHESGGADAIDATGLTGAGGSGGTPALVLSTSNSAGAASTFIRTNDQLALFDATAPSTQAFGDSAAAGSAAVAARRDHKHAMPSERAASSTTPAPIGAATNGVGTTDARSDHVHATGAGTPFGVSTAAAIGTGPAAAMTDHVHPHEVAHTAHDTVWDAAGDLVVGTGADTAAKLAITVPAANILEVLGVVNGETTATWKAVHDGTNPAAVGTAAAGTALTASHRDHVHATGAGTPTTDVFGATAAVGTGPAAAMTDHVHGWATDPHGYGAFYSCDPLHFTTATTWGVANVAVYMLGRGAGSVSTANWRVSATAGNVSIGLYSVTNTGTARVPGTRLQTTGAIACPGNGIAATSLGGTSACTQSANYWALSTDNGSMAPMEMASSQTAMPTHGHLLSQGTAHPIPTGPAAGQGLGAGGRPFWMVGS
jgi:hypothetical protein